MSDPTSTAVKTLKATLDAANPNELADALRQVALGTLLTPVVYDSASTYAGGAASATIALDPPALFVQSARVYSSGTAASVGSYMVGDANATVSKPAGGASAGAGVAKLSADGATLTFPNTVTRAVIQYLPLPATALTDAFEQAS